jgi:SnoaL-like domain
MDATAMLREFCDAVERQDGRRFANLFCEDGVYHDAFYGEFVGQAKIAEMINDWFFKSATDMRWDMHDPVCDGKILYARYISATRRYCRKRAAGVPCSRGLQLCDCAMAALPTIARSPILAPAFADMNFAPERIVKILRRQGDALKARPELARHLA